MWLVNGIPQFLDGLPADHGDIESVANCGQRQITQQVNDSSRDKGSQQKTPPTIDEKAYGCNKQHHWYQHHSGRVPMLGIWPLVYCHSCLSLKLNLSYVHGTDKKIQNASCKDYSPWA